MADLSDDELISLAKQKGIPIPPSAEPSDDELIAMAKEKGISIPSLSMAPSAPGGALGAALIPGLNEATFGAAPFIYGAVMTPKGLLEGKPLKQAYEEPTLAYQRALESYGQEHPYITPVSKGLGMAAMPLAAEKAVATGAVRALPTISGAPVVKAGVKGAAQGFLQTPAPQEGDVSFLSPEKRGQQAIIGAALGGGLHGLLASGPSLEKTAQQRAFKAVGPYQRDVLKNQKDIEKIGKVLLDRKVVSSIPKSYEGLSDAANKELDKVGQQLGDHIIRMSDQAERSAGPGGRAGVNRAAVSASLERELLEPRAGIEGMESERNTIQSMLDEFSNRDQVIGIKEAQALKERYGNLVPWKKVKMGEDISPKQEFYLKAYHAMRQGIEDAADALANKLGPGQKSEYMALKNDYGALKTAAKIANERSGREFANRFISPSDYGAGAVGYMAHGGPAAMAATLANKAARRYGNQVAAKMAQAGAGLMKPIAPLSPVSGSAAGYAAKGLLEQ